MLKLEVIRGELAGRAFELTTDATHIGRADGNELLLPDEIVSSDHARVVTTVAGSYVLHDQKSTNGTSVTRKGARVAIDSQKSFELQSGDVVELGSGEKSVQLAVTIAPDAEDAHVVAVKPISQLEAAKRAEQGSGLRALYEVQTKIGAAEGLDEVVQAISEAMLELVPRATHVTVILREDDAHGAASYVPIMTRVRGQNDPASGPIPITRSVFRKVVSERAAVLAADAPQEVGQSESMIGAHIRSTLGVPLWRGDEILGVIQIDNRESTGVFTSGDLDLAGLLAHNASLAVANARLVKRLRAAEERLRKENTYLKGREESRRTGGRGGSGQEIIGQSNAMKSLNGLLDKVVDTKVTVLIEGETGVGKELVAAAVHYRSRRRDKLFVGQN
ncbi:MAG: GAF domain-containing protein, partial [Polyangiaceae bacterium]